MKLGDVLKLLKEVFQLSFYDSNILCVGLAW